MLVLALHLLMLFLIHIIALGCLLLQYRRWNINDYPFPICQIPNALLVIHFVSITFYDLCIIIFHPYSIHWQVEQHFTIHYRTAYTTAFTRSPCQHGQHKWNSICNINLYTLTRISLVITLPLKF